MNATSAPRPAGPVGDYLHDPGGHTTDLLHRLRDLASQWAPIAVPSLALLLVVIVAGGWWLGRWRHARLSVDARTVTILAPPEVDPDDGARTLWTNLTGLLRPAWRRLFAGQPHLAFEYTWTGPELRIAIWVPGVVPPGLVERAVHAAWPGAHTTTAPATTRPITARHTVAAGGVLRLTRPEVLPLRTEFDTDPLRPLLGAAAGLADHDRAHAQILARPVTGRRLARARRHAARLRAGTAARPSSRVFDLLTPRPPSRRTGHGWGMPVDPEHTAQTRAVAGKLAQPQWAVIVNYVVTSPRTDTAAHDRVRGRAHALTSAFTVFTGHNSLRRRRHRQPGAAIATRRLRRGDLLSVAELAALAHLPADRAVPGLTRAGARAVPPAPTILTPGPTAPSVKPLGLADTGTHRPVGLTVADARHHTHILGATGAGKSTLLAHLILADIAAGRGVVVIDPKGDLINDVLDRLPPNAVERLTLIDPDARTRPTLNVLDPGDNPAMAADHLVGVFARVFAGYWGPRTDDVFRSAVLTLTAVAPALPEPPTLADIPRLLTDHPWRTHILRALPHDPVLAGFWTGYHQSTDAGRAAVIAPLMNKLRAFLLRDFVRQTVGAGPHTINLAHHVDRGGIALARLPKGELGDDTTRLLGSLLVARVWQAALRRARQPEHTRPDATLYVDEAHNFLTLPYATEDMLAEARAYRLSMVLANQHLAQLPRELRDALATNARNKVIFTVSPADARDLERHTTPNLTAHDLAHLDRYHAAAQLLVNAQPTPAFTLTTDPLPPPVRDQAHRLRCRPAPSRPPARTSDRAAGTPPLDPRRAHPTRGHQP